MKNARLRTKAGGHFYMQNENRTAAKDCPVSGEDLFFAHSGTVQISGIIFAIYCSSRVTSSDVRLPSPKVFL